MQKEFVPDREGREAYFTEFREKYPQEACGIIGRSILGKDIDYYRIGTGKRHVVAVGAHCGTEYITASALYDFVGFLCEKAARGAVSGGINIPFLLQKFTYWIIPCLNPDGVDMNLCGIEKTPLYERQLRMNGGSADFSAWQANARGVDLRYNYNCGFAAYKRREEEKHIQPGGAYYSGEYPESEPETKSLANLLRTLAPVATVSFHSPGAEISVSPKTEYARRVAERLASSVGYENSSAESVAACEGFSGYAGEMLGIPSFTVKLGRGENPLADSANCGMYDALRKMLVFLPTRL